MKEMVADFHRRGVRVLFPNMPWDVGTRPEPRSMAETIAGLLAGIGADGVNGDTFSGLPRSYRVASDATGHPLVLEPENYPESDEMLNWNSMSWGYWRYGFVPTVSRGKWLEPSWGYSWPGPNFPSLPTWFFTSRMSISSPPSWPEFIWPSPRSGEPPDESAGDWSAIFSPGAGES